MWFVRFACSVVYKIQKVHHEATAKHIEDQFIL